MSPRCSQLLAEHELKFLEPLLDSVALPAIRLRAHPGAVLGIRSKYGGSPDLPEDFVWPTHGDAPLDYILQIRLDELPGIGSSPRLPSSGLLTFFYDIENQPWGFEPNDLRSSLVEYTPMQETIRPFEVPNIDTALEECAIVFEVVETFPSEKTQEFRQGLDGTTLPPDYVRRYRAFRRAATDRDLAAHRLLGHPELIQGEMRIEAQLVTNGIDCGSATYLEHPNYHRLVAGAADWMLLLQLASDDNLEVMWGDMGNLYYWIRKADLKRRNFGNLWVGLQCY